MFIVMLQENCAVHLCDLVRDISAVEIISADCPRYIS